MCKNNVIRNEYGEILTQCENVRLGGVPCERLYNCCDCGGNDCGCACCWSCNACEFCLNDDS